MAFTYVIWRTALGDMDSNDKDKVSGHSTVEQATTVFFTEMEEGGSTIAINIIITAVRERG